MLTIVVNNREALEIAQYPHLGSDKSGVPQLGESVTFIPGVNLIESDKLKILMGNKAFASKFSTKIARSPAPEQNAEKVGEFIFVKGKEGLPEKNTLAKLPPEEVSAIIEDTYSVVLLKRFLEEEGRDSVRAELQRQIAKMETGGAPHGAAGR